MGALRGIVLVFVCVLIFISFLLLGTFATLNSSLDYETVKPQIKPLIESSINLTQIYDYEDILNNSCLNESEFFYNDSNYTFVIPCEVIANGTEAIFDYQVDLLIKENYYKNYNCSFWKCFKEETPLFLVSQYAKDYWNSKFYRFLFISIILLILIFLLVQKKTNFPLLTGILLIVSFIPIANLDSIGKFILKLIFSSMKNAINGMGSIDLNAFVMIFFSQANSVFLTGLTIGLVLIAIGILLKLFKVGFKIGKLFRKKEEISKKSQSTTQEEPEQLKEKKVEPKINEKKQVSKSKKKKQVSKSKKKK